MLQAWEHGREYDALHRPLALLASALPECDIDTLGQLPLAKRNALLMELRGLTFGSWLEGFAVCPECGAQLEFATSLEELRGSLQASGEECWIENNSGMRMRPVNTHDLAAAIGAGDAVQARRLLIERTVQQQKARMTEDDPASMISDEWLDRFDRLNASAEIRLVLPCANCGQRLVLDFDIAHFLWREVAVEARRLLAEIHCLARAYGWSEQAILLMSTPRRAAYLEMLKS